VSGALFSPELLERCISCGFCLPACPTYRLTGSEPSSPRGRINLMRAVEEGRLAADDPGFVEESSFCLGCRACEPVCPAGVRYGELLEEWRGHVWHGRNRPLRLRALLWAADRRWRVRALGRVRRHPRATSEGGPQLLLGCFERALFPSVSRAAVELTGAAAPAAQGCCGALHAHNGEPARGRELAERLGEDLPGRILTTSGGCAVHLAGILGRDRVVELSEWLGSQPGPPADQAAERPRVALQDSCHLRNGLGVWREPRRLIAQVADYVELPSAAVCCGAAGTYATLRPRDSAAVLEPKLDEIAAAEVDLVVAVNPGCLRQLRAGLRRRGLGTRAVHLAELLAGKA
jgi:glycolate oxidase iron-sulfur subunit